jgi:hypothetical protein
MQQGSYDVYRTASFVLIIGLVTLSGCSTLQGFGSLSDGTATTTAMRKAAALARAEADALDQIADQQSQSLQQAIGASQEVASMLGAPEVVTGLIGAIAGILVPSPIKRKKPV